MIAELGEEGSEDFLARRRVDYPVGGFLSRRFSPCGLPPSFYVIRSTLAGVGLALILFSFAWLAVGLAFFARLLAGF